MALKTSSTFASRTGLAGAIALALILLANLWVGMRLPALIPESSIDMALEMDHRLASFPDKQAVKVLVFGNSHANTGLRPTPLAHALGLHPGEVYNLAIPGASSREERLLAAACLPQFPQARLALIQLDEYFLTADFPIRERFLTRFSPRERWRYAVQCPDWGTRLSLMAAMAFPIADFLPALKDAFKDDRRLFLERLLYDTPARNTSQAYYAELPEPFGMPVAYDDPRLHTSTLDRRTWLSRWGLKRRAMLFAAGAPSLPEGLSELEALCRLLEAHGCKVVLLESPLTSPLRQALDAQPPGTAQRYRLPLQAYLTATGRTLMPAPPDTPVKDFYDCDHLNRQGAHMLITWVARHVVPEARRL